MKENINYFTQVKNILSDVGLEATEVTPDANLSKDLGLDSLDLADLVMRLEVDFGVQISDTDASELVTVQDVVNYLALVKA